MNKSHFLKNTVFFSIATLISRILGYGRDAAIAYVFGANPTTDAFFVAWRIPNTLRQLIAEGSFNAAFIPIYTRLIKEDNSKARNYISSLFSYYSLVLSILTFIGVVFSEQIVSLIAPGLMEKGVLNEASKILKMVFPYLVLVGWVSFFMAVLNTKDHFFIPAVSPALLNISFIFSALFLSNFFGIYALGIGALLGGVFQVILQIPILFKERLIPNIRFSYIPEIKETFSRLLPAFASFGISQFAFVIDTIIASFLVGGAISYLYYANRIFQLPIGLFAVGLGNALLVSLSRHYSEKNNSEFYKDLNEGIRFAIFISLPATVGMIILGNEIITLLLERGAFTERDSQMTFYALVGYSIGLIGYALARPFKSACFAVGDMKTPLISTGVGLITSIFFAVLFGFILNWGVFGLAFASSIGGLVSYVYLHLTTDFKINLTKTFLTLFKVAIGSSVMALIVFLIKGIFDNVFYKVAVGVLSGLIVYFVLLYVLNEYMAKVFLNKIFGKFNRF